MKILLPIIAALVLISGYFMLSKNGIPNITPKTLQVSSPSPTPQFKTFKSSSVMKFTIDVPSNFSVEENLGRVKITAPDGQIFIDRNGTNFNNLKDYLKDLDMKNKTQILENKTTNINGYDATIRSLKFSSGENQKTFVIFANNWIYNIFTNSENLYSTLDQIAQSFRYTP